MGNDEFDELIESQRKLARKDALYKRVGKNEDWFERLDSSLDGVGRLARMKRLELSQDLLVLARLSRSHDERVELLARAQVHASLAGVG